MSEHRPSAEEVDPRKQLRTLILLAIPIGLVGAVLASIYSGAEHAVHVLLWEGIPEALGSSEAPGWLVVVILLVGAYLVHLALQLPGKGGHGPLAGLAFDIDVRTAVSVVLASLASLAFGAVLGPEAPLLAIGCALGFAIASKESPAVSEVLVFAGAVAAIGTILGNPLITAVLLLEALVLSGKTRQPQESVMILVTTLIALTSSYVLHVGIASFDGLPSPDLAVPDLPAYENVQAVDLIVAIPVAIAAAVVVVIARDIGLRVHRQAKMRPLVVLLTGALMIAFAALAFRQVTDESVSLILFSGQEQIPDLLGLTSVAVVLWIVLFKTIAYGISLGAGFRGGPIFPGVFLGLAVGLSAALVIDNISASAMAAVGIGAATAAGLRMPFTSLLLAVLLCISAGVAVTVPAALGVVIGLIVGIAAAAREPDEEPAVAVSDSEGGESNGSSS